MDKIIFCLDFDGVFVENPWEIHVELLRENQDKYPIVRMVVLDEGGFPEHLHDSPEGQEYYKLFEERYFSQKVKPDTRERLKKLSAEHELVILSLNIREVIERFLLQNNIEDLIDGLYARFEFQSKKIFFEELREKYPDRKIKFLTDTSIDIQQAILSKAGVDLYVVPKTKRALERLTGEAPEEKVIGTFF
jgi:FMN phosphatase YigB (HAD superfamily)